MNIKEKLINMKVNKRLMLSYIIVLILLVIGIVVSVTSLVNIGNQIQQFYEHPFKVSARANTINTEFEGMQKSVFRSISTADKQIVEESIKNAKEAGTIISDNLAIIKKLFLGDQKIVEQLEDALNRLAPMREEVLNLASENKNKEAADYMEKNNILVIEEAQEYLNTLIETADTTGSNMIIHLQRLQSVVIIVLVILCVVSLVISMSFAKIITDSIKKPVDELETVAENLATGKLDMDVITYESKDELGNLSSNMKKAMIILRGMIVDIAYLTEEIAKGNFEVKTKNEGYYVGEFQPLLMAIREMNTNLSAAMSQINDASDQVTQGASQMAESAQTLAEGAADQAGTVEELNAAIDNVSNMARTMAEDTQKAADEVSGSVQRADSSRGKMKELIQAMERIDATSKEIGNIISEIEDIASQTNLLSLNASIEAARAGEAGKGFAVVADQIGKLASDSAQSASNTRELIMKTLDEIKIGNDITNDAFESFEEIIKDVESFSEIAKSTSQKSSEQYNSLHRIDEGVEQISSVVQSNSATAQETSATSEELAAQAESLKALVARFRLKQGAR